jgi:hypothetical protein
MLMRLNPKLSEQKIADINFQYQQELEEDIGKQVKDLQEKYSNINLIEKYRYQLMEKQERVNDHFDVAEFIEELMEEERRGIKKEQKKMIEVSVTILKMISLLMFKTN